MGPNRQLSLHLYMRRREEHPRLVLPPVRPVQPLIQIPMGMIMTRACVMEVW